MLTNGGPQWTMPTGWRGSSRSSTRRTLPIRRSASASSAASGYRWRDELDPRLPVPAPATRARGRRTRRGRTGGGVPAARRYAARDRQRRPVHRRERAVPRHRGYPWRRADRRLPAAQAGLRPGYRGLPGRTRGTGTDVPGPGAQRSGRGRVGTMLRETEPLCGFTIAVTADRRRDELAALLERRGARVVLAPALRIVPLADDGELRAATTALVEHPPDIVVACTGIGLRGWLEAAEGWGLSEPLKAVVAGAYLIARGPKARGALRTDVLAACVGPVTAAPLHRRGIPVMQPSRARLGALVRALVEELPKRAPTLRVAGQEVTLRGHAALVDGSLRPMAPAPMAVLRALAAAPGRVLSRAALLTALPRGADEHAVEMAVARLRAALGGSAFVQTVVKRGYRLRVD